MKNRKDPQPAIEPENASSNSDSYNELPPMVCPSTGQNLKEGVIAFEANRYYINLREKIKIARENQGSSEQSLLGYV